MDARRGAQQDTAEDGFTIVELVVSLAVLAVVMAPLAGVFWSSMRTAGVASHRTDGSSVASREIEAMRAIPYGHVGFYADQPGYATTFDGFTTVLLGSTSPSSGTLIPQVQPLTPDASAASSFAPDPNPSNASPISQGGVKYSVTRSIVWVGAQDASTSYASAYKRLTVVVRWSDQAGAHSVRQDSLLYPGGLGKYQGSTTTVSTTTTAVLNPSAPTLNAITGLADPAGETQVPLTWTQPATGAAVTSYSIEYSTSSSFPPGNFSIVTGLAPSITSYTIGSLSANTTYYFAVIAYAGTNSATSNVQSSTTLPVPVQTCQLGALNVTGATTLSTTGTILANNGRVTENLSLSWTTTGNCTHSFGVYAVNPSGSADPGSPYALTANAGTYTATVASSGSKSWAIGLHTFTVWDTTNNKATTVVKTFKICAKGSATC